MDDINTYGRQIKKLIESKKAKVTIYVISALWIAVIMQYAVNSFLLPNKNILEAFVSTNSQVSSFEVEMAGDYGTGFLSETDKKELLHFLASEIGLKVDQPVTIDRDNNDSEIFLEKKGKNAESLLKVVTVEQKDQSGLPQTKHYLIVRLKLYNNIESILAYRSLLADLFKELKVTNLQTTLQITGAYKGKLSLDQMNSIADNMIDNLEGTVAYANRQEDLFTIYAYSGLIEEYIKSLNTKINIHVAMNYDETSNTTKVYLGTPVIRGDY